MTIECKTLWPLCAVLCLLFSGCDDDVSSDTPTDSNHYAAEVPTSYSFDSNFVDGSSVSYGGQTFRHVLISDMKAQMGNYTGRLTDGWIAADGDVTAEMEFYLDYDGETSGDVPLLISTDPAATQSTFGEVGGGKNLLGKLAGNDATGQHKDWATEMVGWDDAAVTTPESLVRHWIATLDAQVVAWSNGDQPMDPDGNPIAAVHVTPEGQDLQQLIQKFLLGTVAFSQGTDDYLDDDIDGKGLNSDNTEAEEGKGYTALEHGWDEGFGYFGAAQHYGDFTDEENASGYQDANGDGSIDMLTEVNFGHSVNAAKRDKGASTDAPTDFSEGAWQAFLNGRHIIAQAGGALSDDDYVALQAERDTAVTNWEKAISATVVHYINDVVQDMDAYGTEDFSYTGLAKHWSEMKGFALSFQFNPRSPVSAEDFAAIHAAMGHGPAWPGSDEAADYRAGLLSARDMLGAAYGFDDDNMSDDNGQNGW